MLTTCGTIHGILCQFLEQINDWLQIPSETRQVEFKEAKTQFDNIKLFRYCVAIANESGGSLILGVSDKRPRKVVGTAAFNNIIEMEEILYQRLAFRVTIEEVNHPDGQVLVFQIPSRLPGSAYSLEGAYWMRTGSELVPMSEDQLRKIHKEGQPLWLEQSAKGNCSGQDVVQLLDTQSFFDLLNLPYPTTQQGVLEHLVSEGIIVNSHTGYSITHLGAILLAKKLSSFPSAKRKAPRVIVYSSESKLTTISDYTLDKGYAACFNTLIQYIMGLLPQNEVIQGALRKEVKLVPEIIIRELVANALIHQDLEMTGASPMIEIYTDRIEISNPGNPIVPLERFIDGYASRNEKLSDLMRRFNICEERSSGIDRVIDTTEVYQLPAPDFQNEFNRTLVIIYGPREFGKMDKSDRIRACYQHCVLQYIMRKRMTNQSLRDRFKLSDRSSGTISQIISATIIDKKIKIDPDSPSARKYAKYIPYWA